jgi:hypothetical protein
MMYMCKQIKKENIVSMYDERVAELEHLLNVAENKLADEVLRNERLENTNKHVRAKAFDETSMMGGIIRYLLDECSLEEHHLEMAIKASSWIDNEVTDVLIYHECVPEGWLQREYYVTVNVPVSVCLTIVAKDAQDAEEIARDLLEGNGLESYDMEYNSYYDGEYTVEEA